MSSRMTFKFLVALLPLAVLTSCGVSHTPNPPMEKIATPLRLSVKKSDRSDMGLVVGARRIPGTQFVVLPKGEASAVPVILFGPLAVFAEDAVMEKKLENEQGEIATLQRIDVYQECVNAARARSLGKGALADSPPAGNGVFEAEPICQFKPDGSGTWRIWLDTQLSIRSSTGSRVWIGAVSKRSPEALPIGEWTKNDGARLRSFLKDGYRQSWDEINGRLHAR